MIIAVAVIAFIVGFGVKGSISEASKQSRDTSAIAHGYRLCMFDLSRYRVPGRFFLVKHLETELQRRLGQGDHSTDHNK